ncbi:galactosylceramidase [Arachidicoccus rhizosphaerae]|uniref:galactosylceramidase n=1 Tax=Arachidicoccus rhizosphaerae TaxID=551991 RepID=A0A1H4CCD7_9BACT|nr:hypothetical protein [Arachidicoccus rhizosphaerae]SEA58000.1 galactosylceramidase [Arachidicoccus rhizosphaerae]
MMQQPFYANCFLKPAKAVIFLIISVFLSFDVFAQSIAIDGHGKLDRFDGIGAVSGGGGTSLLLKDYPAAVRRQILDLLFKPRFGASVSALLVEVPGDGNSTQGSEPSHMHSSGDLNYYRGYEWWLMKEAKKRNPDLTLDANVWSAPGWISHHQFWTQQMCDYVVKWIQGLKSEHGLILDAIGCRNERGVNLDYVKMLRKTLDANGLNQVRIHAFDNWQKDKFDWAFAMLQDSVLRSSVAILSAHTMSEIPTPDSVKELAAKLHKPIWNSEEHVYLDGFDCALGIVDAFNKNYIVSGATKIVNWYLVGSTYDIEPFAAQPPMMIAREPWSGHYELREAFWGYAHYGQFTKVGWQYIRGACDTLKNGGSYVTLKAPEGGDYSIIIETKGATGKQTLNFALKEGMSTGTLAVWKSDHQAQFVRLTDIAPVSGRFSITLDTGAIYSLTTTRGQQKGGFKDVAASRHFPFPYQDDFEGYKDPRSYGYLPNYTADIAGVFELSSRSDRSGKCLKQVLPEKPQCWAPEWEPYTIIGDPAWKDYQVAADVYIEHKGAAGIMGKVNATGYGFGVQPNAYYMTLSDSGRLALYVVSQDEKVPPRELAAASVKDIRADQWHRLTLVFEGAQITGLLDGKMQLRVSDSTYKSGMAGLMTLDMPMEKAGAGQAENGESASYRTVAEFDNLYIAPVSAQGQLTGAATVPGAPSTERVTGKMYR